MYKNSRYFINILISYYYIVIIRMGRGQYLFPTLNEKLYCIIFLILRQQKGPT